MSVVEDIVQSLFEFQINMKYYHWMTSSYPRHIASDRMNERMLDLVDRFVEVLIGHHGRPLLQSKKKTNKRTIEYDFRDDESVKGYMKQFSNKLSGMLNMTNDLCTIRDDMVEAIHQALYLFELK